LCRFATNLKGLAPTYPIWRLLSFMVASTLKFTRIYWRTNALVLLLVHLEEYLD